jgi:hypothetical protein
LNANDTQRIIEELVDSTSVYDVLEALVTVCDAKAEHLRANWPDLPDSSALMWERMGHKLSMFNAKLKFRP